MKLCENIFTGINPPQPVGVKKPAERAERLAVKDYFLFNLVVTFDQKKALYMADMYSVEPSELFRCHAATPADAMKKAIDFFVSESRSIDGVTQRLAAVAAQINPQPTQ